MTVPSDSSIMTIGDGGTRSQSCPLFIMSHGIRSVSDNPFHAKIHPAFHCLRIIGFSVFLFLKHLKSYFPPFVVQLLNFAVRNSCSNKIKKNAELDLHTNELLHSLTRTINLMNSLSHYSYLE